MAYLSKDLSVISYANGFTLWHYATLDSAETLKAANYFLPASDMLRSGDMVLANSDIGSDIISHIFQVGTVSDKEVSVKLFAATSN